MIRLSQVSKTFGETVALHPTDLAVKGGQTTVLIGPSGCGKSTILRLIIGLIEPSTGSVIVEGEQVSRGSILGLRRRMGYVIQDGGLFPHLTAAQNISLMATHLRYTQVRMRKRIDELCELTHFPKDGLSRFPAELSGGQRQRVSLMRALMLEPSVLLLDEPLAALDPMVRASLQTQLKEIFQRLSQTVVLVTHDMAEAAYFGDRIVLLKAGEVVQEGTVDDLRDRPAAPFVTEFMSAQRSLVLL